MPLPLSRLFENHRPAVLVVGDVMCDVYLWGKVKRISPEAPVPIFEGAQRKQALGGAGNVAANLRALGCEVYLLGVVGADAAGQRVRDLLRQQGMGDSWLLEDLTRPTTEKTRLIAHQQQVLRLDQENRAPLSAGLVERALIHVENLMPKVDGVVCSDYCKGVCTEPLLRELFSVAGMAGHPVIVDPKAQDFSLYFGATALTPNLAEAEYAAGFAVDGPGGLEKAAAVLLQKTEARALLVTQGKDGMSLFHPPDAPVHVPARAREVFDSTGAGDTVVAAFTMALLCGFSLPRATCLANAAAGIVVGKIGTAVVTPEELDAFLTEDDSWRD
jgi:D-beta-D-heptose 7-phosphate kinase/D-beta-D-heptose 1-phosphate adenosyltransferase